MVCCWLNEKMPINAGITSLIRREKFLKPALRFVDRHNFYKTQQHIHKEREQKIPW